ncbi:unnamed protein product, partial [Oppiella nova]
MCWTDWRSIIPNKRASTSGQVVPIIPFKTRIFTTREREALRIRVSVKACTSEMLYLLFHNWAGGKQDKSDRNQVLNNKIGPGVTAECIDIKEGSCCGLIKGNTFDGSGLSGQNSADSWIDVKGDSYDIEGNTGSHSLKDGFQ